MNENEIHVSRAFSKQSFVFDEMDNANPLSEYFRSIYRQEVNSYIKPNSNILELNCGTGIDAIYFANKAHHILATDISPLMIDKLNIKIQNQHLERSLETMICSYHELDKLNKKKFDYILSNFGGLNCTNQLNTVLSQFSSLLNEDGKITLALMPKICPWELIMVFKAKFKTAFRRWSKRTTAHIEGEYFYCYYYNPNYVINCLRKDFKLISLKGVFITVPPEFYHGFVERYPKLFFFLSWVDSKISKIFPFNYCCDHYIITLQKKVQ